MANPLSIFSGPGQITMWDSTNGYYNFGYNKEIMIQGEPQTAELLDGNLHQITTLYKLSAPLLQSNQAALDAIIARRGVKQKLFIIGTESMLTIDNVLLSVGMKRSFKGSGDAHTLELQAQTAIESDVALQVNLLGADGKFESDSNSDGFADGWSGSVTSKSIQPSFLSGGGNCQQIEFGSTGQWFSKIVNIPVAEPTRFTFSAYVKDNGTVLGSQFKIFVTLKTDGVTKQSFSKVVSVDIGAQTRVSIVADVVTPTEVYNEVHAVFGPDGSNTADILIDNAQLEFGDLSTFRTD